MTLGDLAGLCSRWSDLREGVSAVPTPVGVLCRWCLMAGPVRRAWTVIEGDAVCVRQGVEAPTLTTRTSTTCSRRSTNNSGVWGTRTPTDMTGVSQR